MKELMESKIKELFEAIQEKQELLVKRVDLFGYDDPSTQYTFRELVGMEKAFEIVAGMSPTQYFIETAKA